MLLICRGLYEMEIPMEHTYLMDKIKYDFPEYQHEEQMEFYQDIIKCTKMKEYVSLITRTLNTD